MAVLLNRRRSRRDFLKIGVGTGAAGLAAVALPPWLTRGIQAAAQVPNPQKQIFFRSIDTMALSRDLEQWGGWTTAMLQRVCELAKAQGASHIAVDSLYEFPGVAQQWVDAARAAELNVWFRSGPSATPASPSDWLKAIETWVKSNPGLFASGDIVDPAPECYDWSYWGNTYGGTWTYSPPVPNGGTDAYNQFMLNVAGTVSSSLSVSGVITGIISASTYMATNIGWDATSPPLYPSTTAQLGYVTIDSYPDSSSDPATCAAAWLAEIHAVAQFHTVPIVIGEMGYCAYFAPSDDLQLQVLEAEFQAFSTDTVALERLAGVNYWVGPSYPGDGASSNTLIYKLDNESEDPGAYIYRPGAAALSAFFASHQFAPARI